MTVVIRALPQGSVWHCTAGDPAHVRREVRTRPGDEMLHPFLGGFNRDWGPEESPSPVKRPNDQGGPDA